MKYSEQYLGAFAAVINKACGTSADGGELSNEEMLRLLCEIAVRLKRDKGRLLFCGNGASAAFASHMSLDWSKNGGIAAICMNDGVQLTALGNDLGYDEVFSTPLRWHGRPNDVLVAISSSGNSPNVLKAIDVAREIEMKVVTFTGLKPDNACRRAGDVNVFVPAKTYGMVECAHQLLLHMWLDCAMGVKEWDREGFQNMNADEFTL